MKKHLLLGITLLLTCSSILLGHAHHSNISNHPFDRTWKTGTKHIHGALNRMRSGMVFIETDHEIKSIPYMALSAEDKSYVDNRYAAIRILNLQHTNPRTFNNLPLPDHDYTLMIVMLSIGLIAAGGLYIVRTSPRLAIPLGMASIACFSYGFNDGYQALKSVSTNPLTIDSAFAPFKKEVTTSWDAQYFRVGSLGLATTHEMMKGITAWQQQVPIPQCYLNANAWSIPLNPVMATNSIPVDQKHFTRGAIAIAINGIPIFNPYTNTGVDAFLDGQLDDFGGHSGRADDYHYHIAPTHLYGFTAPTMPVAYAFDGFAVYGEKEPDGSAMKTLDAHHGHADASGVYHYHGTNTAPYMIASFAGEVTEDSTNQLIPQSTAKGCRPALTPLKGAVITGHKANGNNGYTLTYTLNGQTNTVQYSWTPQGNYTYIFTSPTGSTTNNYKGNAICSIPVTGIEDAISKSEFDIINIPNGIQVTSLSDLIDISQIHLQLYSINGSLLLEQRNAAQMNLSSIPFGRYFLRVLPSNAIHSFVHLPR